MNKSVLGLMMLTIIFLVSLPVHAKRKQAPEVELSKIDGSSREFYRTLENLKEAFIDPAPLKREDGLAVGVLSNKTPILELAKEIAGGEYGRYDSLLIAYNNELVFESYYAKGRVNLPHKQASAQKGYLSFAVGRAIQLGYLSMADLHKPVLQLLKGVDKKDVAAGVEKITLHHTLSMRSGLRISEEKKRDLLKNPQLLLGQKLAQVYFSHTQPITADSQSYYYQFMDPQITMLVLDAVVPGTSEDFIKSELLDKLKMTNYFWSTNVNNVPELAHHTSMTSRDMIKWATLLKQNGFWQGEQLISRAFLKKATNSIVKPHDDDYDFSQFRYGYYFWGTKLRVEGKNYDVKLAWGGGGQFVIAVEELDLVVAITAQIRMADDKTFELLEKRILPAFVLPESLGLEGPPALEGPYLGQKPPGLRPEAFAPGIVSTEYYEYGGVFTPDMKEFYLVKHGGKYEKSSFVVFQNKNKRWRESVLSPRLGQPFFSADGRTMHLGRHYMLRVGAGWSEVKSLGAPFKDLPIMRLTASSTGSYFFDEFKSDKTGAIRYSRLVNEKYEEPKLLGKNINSGKSFHPFIAADESYLIFDGKREGGYGDSDLYIAYRQQNGSWGEAINLGDKINTAAWEASASVTPDGKYLFFNRNMGTDKYENVDIFWVDAEIIERLRPKREPI